MKRFILPTLFFFACTFSYPVQARAAVPLAIIAASAVGAAMAASATGAYYAKNGHAPEYVSDIAGAVASASDRLFQPSYLAYGPLAIVTAASFPNQVQAYVGKEAAVGARLQDIYNQVKDNMTVYPDLYTLFDSNTLKDPATYPTNANLGINAVFISPIGNRKITSSFYPYDHGAYATGNYITSKISANSGGATPVTKIGTMATVPKTDLYYCGTKIHKLIYTDSSNLYATYYSAQTTATTDNPTNSTSPGAEVPQWSPIKQALANANAAIADDARKAISKVPPTAQVKADAVPTSGTGNPPVALTPSQLEAALKKNTAEVAQKAAEAAAQIAAANPNDATAQIAAQQASLEAAKAAQEAAVEEAKPQEETFSGITDNPFTKAYNPGEYDIPARFETFLNTVKSSGLFSFSSGFFNSLPGGGSPIFTINGGQTFGTHTIDFSQTMTTGLAVLKSILLACFGFLSIRAVIMKR